MFTGIIENLGTVKSIEKKGAFGRITIETGVDMDIVKLGDSISVNGACLTVTALSKAGFSADLSDETLNVTTLGELKAGDRVNLEFALTVSKPLGGHFVTGHVDGIGSIKKKTPKGASVDLEVAAPSHVLSQIVKKGSVAIDGISLTVADLTDGGFRIAIIPHTLKHTTLSLKPEGSKVNIETDIIGKYVEKFMRPEKRKGISEDFLSEHGFFKK